MSNLILVKYTQDYPGSHSSLLDELRYLDPGEGILYRDPAGAVEVNAGFVATAVIGEWSDGKAVVSAVSGTGVKAPVVDLKFDAGKPRWSLLMHGFALSLAGVVRVLTFGAKKYAAHSWRGVQNGQERYKDALYRHLAAIEAGELIDPESGESHYSHAAFNILALHELEIQNGQ